ncbi:hypothetical protein [Corynebacterium sp. HMSC29G08]|uniref:hypothetical protein n=1 Tax=Corynebacterium sp. HMSC29G08 TaxID=1581069 RepID=UPI0008A2F1BF|nr:hypothetical protein [Corynebacterium sp. HMSC29G08]OFT83744.1 hypothetical protein HMPREF3101_05775 [Corynebacterium sp. HMSC29G08]
MKRISTALVAAAVATGLAITPAVAEEPVKGDNNVTTPVETPETPETPGEGDQTPGEGDQTPGDQTPAEDKKSSGVNTGSAIGTSVGILSAVLTLALIIFSNPKGIDKAIDMLNANFGLGLPKFGF